ncbi:hypothetical protein MKY41_10715 [Sporosarcina sp. FSL W7-1349]|uniref:hypothetical protein n=1 Tax=Sporosarcina sp. FSL W7-1349 TaxID=2921561 RepID=UPI0030F72BEE
MRYGEGRNVERFGDFVGRWAGRVVGFGIYVGRLNESFEMYGGCVERFRVYIKRRSGSVVRFEKYVGK